MRTAIRIAAALAFGISGAAAMAQGADQPGPTGNSTTTSGGAYGGQGRGNDTAGSGGTTSGMSTMTRDGHPAGTDTGTHATPHPSSRPPTR